MREARKREQLARRAELVDQMNNRAPRLPAAVGNAVSEKLPRPENEAHQKLRVRAERGGALS